MKSRNNLRLGRFAIAAGLCAVSMPAVTTALAPVPASAQAAQPEAPELDLRKQREGFFEYKDPRIADRFPRRGYRMFVSRRNTEQEGPLRDPKTNTVYQHRLQVQVLTDIPAATPDAEPERRADRRFVVHFQKTEEEGLARLVGRVMARLHWVGLDYLGRGSVGNNYINVWLSPEGMAGAEEYKRNIYLHGIGEERAPAEWVRELAHEYSHITIPPAGRFEKPEPFANGYLGERLYMKWLLFDNQQTDLWDQPIDGAAYVANQVLALRTRFLDEGPAAPASEKFTEDGMNFFIGQMLAIEQMYGPDILKGIFNNFSTPRPQNLGGYFTMLLRDMKPAQYAVAPEAYIPSKSMTAPGGTEQGAVKLTKAAYWIFLPGGDWSVNVAGVLPPNVTAKLEGAQLKPAPAGTEGSTTWVTNLPSFNGVWRRLELTAPGGAAMEIAGIQLVRTEGPGAGVAPPTPGAPPRIKPARPRPGDKKPVPIPEPLEN